MFVYKAKYIQDSIGSPFSKCPCNLPQYFLISSEASGWHGNFINNNKFLLIHSNGV